MLVVLTLLSNNKSAKVLMTFKLLIEKVVPYRSKVAVADSLNGWFPGAWHTYKKRHLH